MSTTRMACVMPLVSTCHFDIVGTLPPYTCYKKERVLIYGRHMARVVEWYALRISL